ncbi:Protein sirB2 [Saliniradius amylolyticus]|uniref:Protein sirB2 n=1 Tax=Saliniradius amylolyticus TaxID=2183582 RepID=A0A2S2E1J4_9ALTE|nr:SirB2 family protein [Saliniradius amylolyticus]AWL11504.1 Protein sirB2 [Saliniradius amylolyticus]
MYFALKHFHQTMVALTVALFVLRFYWLHRHPAMLGKKWVKVVPHVIDTLLLLSAAGLCVLIQQYPFVHDWVTEKLMAVLLYILLAFVALKIGRTTFIRWVGFLGAISWLLFAAKVAIIKQPLLFS